MDLMEARRRIILAGSSEMLPPKYTKYDWLRTSGHNARIDTGVSGDDETLRIKCTLMPVVLVDSNISVFGNYKSYSDHYCWRCMTTGTSSSDYYRMYQLSEWWNIWYIHNRNY